MELISKLSSALSRVRALPVLSAISPPAAIVPTAEDLEGHRQAQRLAYRCATEIGRELREGWTEKQAARLMDTYLQDYGVKTFFHRSFAWFGDRTRFDGIVRNADFLPSDRPLRAEDAVILDTAPILHGYVADIGYSLSLAPNPELERARRLLGRFRREIPGLFASPELTAGVIWKQIDETLRAEGFDNCHSRYPFGVLGHRVHRVPLEWTGSPHIASISITAFGAHAYWSLLSRGLFPELLSRHHAGSKIGVWAVEPHLGGQGMGAKFEEILVVEPDRAYWLDDQVPHVTEADNGRT